MRPSWLLLAIGCASRPPVEDVVPDDTPVADAPFRAVVLGSSTAAAFGMQSDPDGGWVDRWRKALSAREPDGEVVNLAVSATTTPFALPTGSHPQASPEHNVTAALALDPQAIVVNFPSNDAAFGIPVDETIANLQAIVAAAGDVPVWIATSQPRRLSEAGQQRLIDLRDRTLSTWPRRSLDFWTPLADEAGAPREDRNLGDGIHPNAAGHQALVEVVLGAGIEGG